MSSVTYIDQQFIEKKTDFSDLIEALRAAFALGDVIVPMRHHHEFPNPDVGTDTTMLLMPAWSAGESAGVKFVTISPANVRFDLPAVQGIYIFLDAVTGSVRAMLEAKSLTAKRTAAASALASSYLSRSDAKSMLMIGTGALSTNLVRAHTSVRPIQNVFVWGRSFDTASAVCDQLRNETFDVEPIKAIKDRLSDVDIVSAATLSPNPLIRGELLVPGQHIDLVGSYQQDTREADNETIRRASVFVDTYQGGLTESGDIVIPLRENVIKESDVRADLFQLCAEEKTGRETNDEITVFKSVGHALEDLAAANYYFDQYKK